MKSNWDINKIKCNINKVKDFTNLLRLLGMKVCSNRKKKLKAICDENNINYSHFSHYKKVNIEDLLCANSTDDSSFIRRKLLKAKIKQNKCEKCGISEWCGKPISIQLHHIDGNRTNNSLENLIMLCPNCHSQTDNYCGKNIEKTEHYCVDCGVKISHGSIRCNKCNMEYRWKNKRNQNGIS